MNVNISSGIVYIDGVEYHQVSDDADSLIALKDKINDLRYTIADMLCNGQALYNDCKSEGLSIGMVEAEGYLRATKGIHNRFQELFSDVD